MTGNEDETHWYARRDGVVRGPFPAATVKRYLLLGRIRLDDELSPDRQAWQAAATLAELIPEEIASLSDWSDYTTLVAARQLAEERSRERRRGDGKEVGEMPAINRRSGNDRRIEDSTLTIAYHVLSEGGIVRSARKRVQRSASLAVVLLLAMLLLVWLVPEIST